MVTDDDCTVAADWVATGHRLSGRDPGAILTGRVVGVGDPRHIPEVQEATRPRDYTGAPRTGALFPNNMVASRSLVLGSGGFDERFGPDEAAEDNDFCYRWLKGGGRLAFEPSLVVHHHDWRSADELERVYVRYARGEGFLYAKHLRGGDLRMLRYVVRDLAWWARALCSAAVTRRPRWTDPRRATLRGMPRGFLDGWRVFRGSP
jgi:GT2 family glycosyltransferase